MVPTSVVLPASAAEALPPVQYDPASLSTAELKRKCNEYFKQLDQPKPPECLMADYEAACEELMHRRTAAGSPPVLA